MDKDKDKETHNKKECVKVAVRCRPLSTKEKLRKYENIVNID